MNLLIQTHVYVYISTSIYILIFMRVLKTNGSRIVRTSGNLADEKRTNRKRKREKPQLFYGHILVTLARKATPLIILKIL